jgi:hypothetical protein
MSKLLGSSRRIRIPRVKASRKLGAGARGVRGQVADAVRPAVCPDFGRELQPGRICPADCKLRAACYRAYVKAMEAAA